MQCSSSVRATEPRRAVRRAASGARLKPHVSRTRKRPVNERSGGRSVVGIVMTVLGGFVLLSAAGAILAFRSMVRSHPGLATTGPWGQAAKTNPGPAGQAIRFMSEHFWAAASVQLGVGVLLLFVGLLFLRTNRRA